MTPNEQKTAAQSSQTPQPKPAQQVNSIPVPAPPPPAEQPSDDSPSQPASSNAPSNTAKQSAPMNNSLVLTIAVAAVVFVLVATSAVLAYQHPKARQAAAKSPVVSRVRKSPSVPDNAGPSNCMPVKTSSLTQASAETEYRSFVKAVVSQNQTCADDLSSTFFLSQAKIEFGAADGEWITAQPQGIRPIWKDLAQLPSTLSDASFTQSTYTRPVVMQQTSNGLQAQSSASTSQLQGIKLSYPVDISQYTGSKTEKWQVSISFVLQSGNIQVDDLVVEPQK